MHAKRSTTYLLLAAFAALIAAGIWVGFSHKVPGVDLGKDNMVACTMEAKICPDGSAVGRTGPNCEFAACPDAGSPTQSTTTSPVVPPKVTGEIMGRVTLSPTCPVERNPPDPACAPKAYRTTVVVRLSGKTAEVGRTTTDADGNYKFAFLPGTYDVEALSSGILPRCETKTVSLAENSIVTADLSCDTGIR